MKTSTTEPMASTSATPAIVGSAAMMPDNRFTQSRCRRPPTNENLSLVDDRRVDLDLHRYQLLAYECSQTWRPASTRQGEAGAKRVEKTRRSALLSRFVEKGARADPHA